jgi:hypothetical protein
MKLSKDDLFRNKRGRITNCPKNKYILGYWGTLRTFHNRWFNNNDSSNLEDVLRAVCDGFILFVQTTIFILAIPVLPFLRAYFDYKNAKKECEEWIKRGNKL